MEVYWVKETDSWWVNKEIDGFTIFRMIKNGLTKPKLMSKKGTLSMCPVDKMYITKEYKELVKKI